jgi:hypothetical protein
VRIWKFTLTILGLLVLLLVTFREAVTGDWLRRKCESEGSMASGVAGRALHRARGLGNVPGVAGSGLSIWASVLPPSAAKGLRDTGVVLRRDSEFGTPRFVGSRSEFLSPPAPGVPPEDVLRAFLKANGKVFTLHESDVLDPVHARISRDVTTPHNGMRSVTWQQQYAGTDVYGAHLALNLTRENRIINVQSRALHLPIVRFHDTVKVTAQEAEAIACGGLKGRQPAGGVQSPITWIWYPLDMLSAVKVWDVLVKYVQTGETHRLLIRADTGEVVEDINLTWSLEPITFQVYTNDSPTPFSPGMHEPTNYVPPLVLQAMLSTTGLDATASPQGWIPDGGSTTAGNNVDAYLDLLDDDTIDPGDRVEALAGYRDFGGLESMTAAVAQAFYLGNLFHDRLYQLGFDETAGNFQSSNFGRGGREGDSMRIEVWNGTHLEPYGQFAQANMTVLNDGSPPRMQLTLWNRLADDFYDPFSQGMRDSALDAEVLFHEAAHGVCARLIGDGYGLSTVQSRGMAEGWCDYMALSLLSEPTDDPHGVYAFGAYVAAWQQWTNNYYFGIRRFPYTTDIGKAPQTLADADPNQIHFGPAIPQNPKWATDDPADNVHRIGEIWALALWECRANLIDRHGYAGNELMLQLVVDAMKLTPVDPSFTEARDAILQADLVNNQGTNQLALWRGFAKRGLGHSATVPASHSTIGIREAFDLPFQIEVVAAEVGGDADGYIEPGENGGLTVVLTSREMDLANMTATLYATSSNVLLTVSNAILSAIPPGGSATSTPPFALSVDAAFPGFTDAAFMLRIESDQGWFEDAVHVRVGNPFDYPPEISSVGATNITETNAWVHWMTGIAANSRIDYGTSTNYGFSTPLDTTLTTRHLVELSNLERAMTYHYRILSEGTNGILAVSAGHTLRTSSKIHVSASSTATQELGTVAAPFRTLQAAADAARGTGDEIVVAQGTYTGTNPEAVLDLAGADWNLTVSGGYSGAFTVCDPDAYPTVIDGERERRGIRVDYGGKLAITGVTITRGQHEWGGGVHVRNSRFYARNCVFADNASTNSVNEYGGALHTSLGSDVRLVECMVVANTSGLRGGGIFAVSAETALTLTLCNVSSNQAYTGGGIYVQGGATVSVDACLIDFNIAELRGGGIDASPFSEVVTKNSTIACNVVKDATEPDISGGGGASVAGVLSGATLTLVNTIVHGNRSALGADLQCSTYGETHSLFSCIGDIYGLLESSNHLIRADPLFANPASGDFHLLYGSPCIDACSPEYSSALFDMDGEPRPFGSAIDMGADEFVDRDGDSMADYWELDQYGGTNVVSGFEDTDGDELTTLGEYMAQTDPHAGDTDGDTMPDGWEVGHSLSPRYDDASEDPDNDRMDNRSEYAADTDPQDAGSLLRLTAARPTHDGLYLAWQGGTNAWQWLEYSQAPAETNWLPILALPPPTVGTNAAVLPYADHARFYRLRAARE